MKADGKRLLDRMCVRHDFVVERVTLEEGLHHLGRFRGEGQKTDPVSIITNQLVQIPHLSNAGATRCEPEVQDDDSAPHRGVIHRDTIEGDGVEIRSLLEIVRYSPGLGGSVRQLGPEIRVGPRLVSATLQIEVLDETLRLERTLAVCIKGDLLRFGGTTCQKPNLGLLFDVGRIPRNGQPLGGPDVGQGPG